MAAVAGLAAHCLPAHAGDGWLTSYEGALAAAEETGRPILTIFTGSDWCQHCLTLEKNVLHTEIFREWARERVVLLMIDLPKQGISQEERHARSRVCIKYGVRSFPSTLLVAPDGQKIAGHSGYLGQSAAAWVAALDEHLPAAEMAAKPAAGEGDEQILSSLEKAVETARDSRRPMLIMVSRPGDSAATTRVASLINDPEFESLTRDHFVVARVAPRDEAANPSEGAPERLLGGEKLPPQGVGVIVTDDGETPLFTESGAQSPQRIVSGLRRFLAARHARNAEVRR
jgi:thiol-disulfide isomerase/thioredoxin